MDKNKKSWFDSITEALSGARMDKGLPPRVNTAKFGDDKHLDLMAYTPVPTSQMVQETMEKARQEKLKAAAAGGGIMSWFTGQ